LPHDKHRYKSGAIRKSDLSVKLGNKNPFVVLFRTGQQIFATSFYNAKEFNSDTIAGNHCLLSVVADIQRRALLQLVTPLGTCAYQRRSQNFWEIGCGIRYCRGHGAA